MHVQRPPQPRLIVEGEGEECSQQLVNEVLERAGQMARAGGYGLSEDGEEADVLGKLEGAMPDLLHFADCQGDLFSLLLTQLTEPFCHERSEISADRPRLQSVPVVIHERNGGRHGDGPKR